MSASGPSLLNALVVAARRFNMDLSVPQLMRDYRVPDGQLTIAQLVDVARAIGLRATPMRLSWKQLTKLSKTLPAVVLLRNGNAMVLQSIYAENELPTVVLEDPSAGEFVQLTLDEARFAAAWTGDILLLRRDYALSDDDQPFGLRSIIGQLLADRRIVRDLMIAGFTLSVLALAPIMFWRLLIDRVLAYGSLDTLTMLCVGMVTLISFETAFGYLRRYFVMHIVRRVDVKLSTQIFNHVIRLPIDFFERTNVGQVVHDMYEFHKIRNFLTGPLFTTVLDTTVLLVILPIMFTFSVVLTLCVLGFAAVLCLWIVSQIPELRRRSGLTIQAETAKGSFLIETLHGARTVKALTLDARRRHIWDGLVARAGSLRFDEGRAANIVQTFSMPIERLMTSGVFALAVYMAITSSDAQIFVGALVAFMMLSQRVAQPLIQGAQLITEFDEVQLAAMVVGQLVNRQPEQSPSKNGIRTPIVGRIEFSGVRFRYLGATSPALDDVSFTIPEGSIFGIMGRSGSGKTTVTRLLQAFHSNYEGLIKLDGVDLRQYDIDHLRSSFGVVMQENFLFSGTIRDTIAAGKPDARFDEVVMAARLAGAEEFIERLQRGYDTWIYEGSPNLSGGQRQRLAIARALITNPRILVLDEATSALDAESEAIVNANLLRIAEGRTLIIISHRLSSLVAADQILVLERGRVYDAGPHKDLIERCDIYANLWHQQNQHLIPRPAHEVISFRPANIA